MEVPYWLFIGLLIIAIPILLIKGLKFTKDTVEWFISGLLAYTLTAVLIGWGLQDWFAELGEFTKYVVFSGLNLVSSIPATVVLRFALKPLFKLLRFSKNIGGD